MASDRQQFERALHKWDHLKQEGLVSVPESAGALAIAVSFQLADEKIDAIKQREFCAEAHLLSSYMRRYRDKKTVLAIGATAQHLKTFIQDPHISDIVLIGHGALSYVYIPNDLDPARPSNRFDWRDLSACTDHLKTGWFTQRLCGNSVRHLSVPLGSLAMTAHNRVKACVNRSFNPSEPLLDRENAAIQPIPTSAYLKYDEVKDNYPYEVTAEETS